MLSTGTHGVFVESPLAALGGLVSAGNDLASLNQERTETGAHVLLGSLLM